MNKYKNAKFLLLALASVVGFVVAIFASLLTPQTAVTKLDLYSFFGQSVDRDGFYRIVLGGIIALYGGIAVFSWFKPERRRKFARRVPFRFAMGLLLALWDTFLGTKLALVESPFFPGPARILEVFLIEPKFVLTQIGYSLRLYALGFVFGVLLGVGTGILIGWFAKANYWISPVLKIAGVVPAVAWMPFALTLFRPPFRAAVFLIVICMWFPVASLTAQGVSSTPKTYFEAARTLGAKTPYLVFRVAVPHAMPSIFTGIGTANAFAFTTLVMAEMVGQPGGLGYYINAAKVWSAYYKVFAAILIMAVLFSLILRGVGLVQSRVLRWQKGIVNVHE